jgi:hypothetical protein
VKEMDQLPDEIWINIMEFSQMPRLARVCKKLYILEHGQHIVDLRISTMNRRYVEWLLLDNMDGCIESIVNNGSMDDLRYFYRYNKIRTRVDKMIICNIIADKASKVGNVSMLRWMLLQGIDNYSDIMTNAIAYKHATIVLACIEWYPCAKIIGSNLEAIVLKGHRQHMEHKGMEHLRVLGLS